VVGVDLHFGALRRARRLLAGESVRYPRRVVGRCYAAATVAAGSLATSTVDLVCADVLDPPLVPGNFGRVVALNVLDSVRRPAQALAVADHLCSVGGELLLASPFTWQSGIVDEDARLGGDDPAAALRALLERGAGLSAAYRVEEECDLDWWLRRDARSAHLYTVRWLRSRKLTKYANGYA
jgi:hypothetical protein